MSYSLDLSLWKKNPWPRLVPFQRNGNYSLSYEHTERQRQRQDPLEYMVMLGNGSGTDFQASQCIPMRSNGIQSADAA